MKSFLFPFAFLLTLTSAHAGNTTVIPLSDGTDVYLPRTVQSVQLEDATVVADDCALTPSEKGVIAVARRPLACDDVEAFRFNNAIGGDEPVPLLSVSE